MQEQGQHNPDTDLETTSSTESGELAIETGENGAVTIEVPENIDNPDVADRFLAKLTPEQLESFQRDFLEKEDKEEGDPDESADPDSSTGKAPSSDEQQQQASAGIPAEIMAALEPEQRAYIQSMEATVRDLGDYADPEVRKGFDFLINDPVVSARIAVLKGEKRDEIMEGMGRFMDPNVLANLKLDFRYDAAGSAKRLEAHVTALVNAARSSERAVFQEKQQKENYNRALETELNKIMESDKTMKSALPVTDAKHPLKPFLKWVEENKSNINLVGLGGPETYSLWLQKTGQKARFDIETSTKARSQTLRNIEKAKSQAAVTLGKSAKAGAASTDTNKLGIDTARFKSDESYATEVWNKFGTTHSKLLMSLATE